jgi:cellulose biosynthesis protein BcsQ
MITLVPTAGTEILCIYYGKKGMQIISLYNLKGGVGKTAACVNLAWLAAADGHRTLVWDLDPQGAASFYFNTEASQRSQTKRILSGEAGLQAFIQPAGYERLHILPADLSARRADALLDDVGGNRKKLRNLLKPVADFFDFVFIDCPPGFSTLADNVFVASQIVLMPVIPTTLSVRTYDLVSAYFEERKIEAEKLMCFFSMVDGRRTMHSEIMEQLSRNNRYFAHYIPYLSGVEKMGVYGAPVVAYAPGSYASVCYQALWTEMKEGLLD